MVKRFRKVPIEVDAVLFTGKNQAEVLKFVYPDLSQDALDGAQIMGLPVVIETLEGDMTASPGDWVVRGVKGEHWPVRGDIFALTYEAIE